MKELTVANKWFLQYFVYGVSMVGIAVANLFDGIAASVAALLFSIVSLVCLSWVIFARKEDDDEMSRAHMQKAKARTMEVCLILFPLALSIYYVVFLITDIRININFITLVEFLLGGSSICIGLLFAKYEKAGD